MIAVAGIIGLLAVAASVVVIVVSRVPSGRIHTGGYGRDLWSGLTAAYAVGLSFAVLPILPAAIAGAAIAGAAAFWIVQRPVGLALTSAVGAVVFGAIVAVVTGLSRPWSAGIFGAVAAIAALFAVCTLARIPDARTRLPDALTKTPARVLWSLVAGVAVGMTAAAPAEETGILLMLAAGAGAVTFVVLTQPDREHPGRLWTAATIAGLLVAAVPPVLALIGRADRGAIHAAVWWAAIPLVVFAASSIRIVFREVIGPFHPQAPRTPRTFEPAIRWVWLGAVTDDGAQLVVRPRDDAMLDDLAVRLAEADGGNDVELDEPAAAAGVARFEATGLAASTRYAYTVTLAGSPVGSGSFRTVGSASGTVRIAAASCASTASNGAVFDAIADLEPDVFCQIGDLHYENIGRNDPGRFRRAFDDALGSPAVTRMMSRVPVAYVYDDHDYGRNNSHRGSKSKPAVWAVYRERVPHHEFGAESDPEYTEPDQRPVYHRFVVGPALVVISDTRSERDPEPDRDASVEQKRRRRLIGTFQENWLIDAPAAARQLGCDVVVWCCSTPWLGFDGVDADTWSGFPDQRLRIANALLAAEEEHRVRVVIVSGDAHMVGLDRGECDRSPDIMPERADAAPPRAPSAHRWQGRVFPAMNAAALDRRGSHKGADYGEFERPGPGQFGVVEIAADRDGRATGLRMSVHDHEGELAAIDVSVPSQEVP